MNPIELIVTSASLTAFMGLGAAAEQRFEAEGTAAATISADWAWGGQAASSSNAWDTLLMVTRPPLPGDQIHVWLRHRHGAVCLKTLAGDQQVELGWSWGATQDFAWSHQGPFPAARLAGGVVVIRGDKTDKQPATDLDCIVLSTSDRQPADPPLAARPGVSEFAIAWDKPIGETTQRSFGLNVAHPFDVAVMTNPRYRASMAKMAPGYIRLLENSSSLWDMPNQRLDHAKIAKLCQSWKGLAPNIMLNISGWPAFMDADQDGRLDEARIGDYAASCADLVNIVNIEGKTGVQWWETSNERDGAYWIDAKGAHRPQDLARIHAACATAMRAVDPTIKVGGPAATRPDLRGELAAFATAAGDSLDFLSYHAYASGNAADSDLRIFERTGEIAQQSQDLERRIAQITAKAGRTPLPGFLDEYNISWTWETKDVRMSNQFSAVFDAMMITDLAQRDIHGSAAWNDCDGIYGKMDLDFNLRPAATVFARSNRDLVGTLCAVTVPADAPRILAVKRANGSRAVMLTNPDRRAVTVQLVGTTGKATASTLAGGVVSDHDAAWDDLLPLPGRSVTWVIDR
ncbi:MAG: hypothetical protein H0X38_02865 [Planctomycetes bacterium]|nr:hypothetical protein [Planctomycetota bacterium]